VPGLTDYRNPHVAEAMKVLGFVQRFGAGIATAQAELRRNGNPPAVFDVRESAVRVVVPGKTRKIAARRSAFARRP
jgi:ATP-dependent DNA helicase RecG